MDPERCGNVRTDRADQTDRIPRPDPAGEAELAGRNGRRGRIRRVTGLVAVIAAAVVALVLALSTVHLLPQFRNPFAETTVDRSSPALLTSISSLSRYEAASGSFQVIVNLSQRSSWLPSFIEGSQTLFVGQGTDIAFVDFSKLKGNAIKVSRDRTAVAITVPRAQLEPAALNVRRSYVFAQQQGLLTRIDSFFSGNPDSQHQVYVVAQRKIQQAARQSALLTQAQSNTRSMLIGLMHSLGFRQVAVTFAAA
ncbi:MAG TPA: DUF4230 domain-containing protein [Streptosporangiaceae bacterium]|nr:DUF4230 domain-containing protein [Streptosporangiaceae bacterium]